MLPVVDCRVSIASSDLERMLRAADLPLDEWGRGPTKTLEHLREEVTLGESRITVDSAGRLLRDTAVVGVDIAFSAPGMPLLRLVETEQVFADGARRVRGLATSLGEKQLPGESPMETARRAVREELGLSPIGLAFALKGTQVTLQESDSYPGLWSRRRLTHLSCRLPAVLFSRAGYEEHQRDKVTRFAWREATSTIRAEH